MQIRKASRKQSKMKLGLSAPSGAGKTMGALYIAHGLAGDWGKICVIDTENASSDLYSHLGGYDVLPLQAPFSPERYMEAIDMVKNAGYEVCIIDSITHEWEYLLDAHGKMSGNSFSNWGKITPRHDEFVKAILNADIHIITTVRRKQEYAMTTNEVGKTKIQKLGTKEMTRDGFDYELTVNLSIDKDSHMVEVLKDRTGLFEGKPEFVITEETGRLIKAWCEEGIDPFAEIKQYISTLKACTTTEEMLAKKADIPEHIANDDKFRIEANKIYNELAGK